MVKTFDPHQVTLIVSAQDLDPMPPGMWFMFEEVMKMYIRMPYKKRISVVAEVTLKQLMRLGGLYIKDNMIFVEILAQAYKIV